MWQHIVCAGSEMAFARLIGLDTFVPHFNKYKTEFDVPSWGEVRYSFNPSKGLRFSGRDDKNAKYVLMVGGLATRNKCDTNNYKSNPYTALGWIYGYQCMEDKWKAAYKNPTWYVPVDQLRPMPNQ
jgi:hypothetical protein